MTPLQAFQGSIKGNTDKFYVHEILDVASMIPVVGIPFDAANAVIYLAEGNVAEAGMSVIGMVPVFGDAMTGAKLLNKGGKAAAKNMQKSNAIVEQAAKSVNQINHNAKGTSKSIIKKQTPSTSTTPPRQAPIPKAESPIWQGLSPHKGNIKKSGKGAKEKFYQWDHTHGDIEVYNSNYKHLGTMDPVTGEMIKPPVVGRELNI